jgi:hypothetical protein
MATYNLTGPEQEIITSWLFENGGYLDAAVNNLGVSARQARAAEPTLNVLTWIRTNTKGALTGQSDWDQCAMIWWIRINNGVNVTNPQRPPERLTWRAYLNEWDASLIQNPGNASSQVPLTAENGSSAGSLANNAHRVQQRNMIAKVLTVM